MFREKIPDNQYFIGKVEVRPSPTHGLGVFALEDLPKRAYIEVSPYIEFDPVILYDWQDFRERGRHIIHEYIFKLPNGNVASAHGYAAVYNHSIYPNAHWDWREGENPAILILAKEEIKKGDEIFIKYCPDSVRLNFMDKNIEV
tara:strand:- start:2172 stop:2603 length:432 start_codon:yes stop_codon:yes gene_type:complete